MGDKEALLKRIDDIIFVAKDEGADAVTVQLLINAQLAQVIAIKDTEIAELKAEIAKLKASLAIADKWDVAESKTFHPVSHRDAICSECGKTLGEHEIVETTNGMMIACPKEEADGNNTCAKA